MQSLALPPTSIVAGETRRGAFVLLILGSISTQRQASPSPGRLSQLAVEGSGASAPKLLVSGLQCRHVPSQVEVSQ